MRTSQVPAGEYVPTADQFVRLHGMPWDKFEEFLRMRGDSAGPRLAYIQGELELMSPSRDHERIKSLIGRLTEAWADEAGIELSPYGSWTLKNMPRKAGAEPDECYIVGEDQDKDGPDLAIEVVWTSGGLDKLEIYRLLGIREVWQWKSDRIKIFVLKKLRYVLTRESMVLPGVDVEVLAACLREPTRRRALRALKDALAGGRRPASRPRRRR